MSKSHHASRDRDMKKKPLLTPKERRMAKHAKKHMHDVQPLLPPDTTHH
jgi:hypothetical protein